MILSTTITLTQPERGHVVVDCSATTGGQDQDRPDSYHHGRYEIYPEDEDRYMVNQLGLVVSPSGTSQPRIADLPTHDDAVATLCRWIQLDGWTERGQDLAHMIRRWEPARRLMTLLDPDANPPTWEPRALTTDWSDAARDRADLQRLGNAIDELPMVRQLDLIREIMFKLPDNERQRWLTNLTRYRTKREAILADRAGDDALESAR